MSQRELTGIRILEDAILENGSEKDVSDYESLGRLNSHRDKTYKTALHYALAVSSMLNLHGCEEKYFHIGGYATLFHIVNTIGLQGVWNWRGSHDLDIVTTEYGIENLLNSYFETQSYESKSIRSKKKVDIKDPSLESGIQIDLYVPENGVINIDGFELPKQFLEKVTTINVLGVDVRVPKIHDLIGMKGNVKCSTTGLPREKDILDIYNLLGCLELNEGFRRKYPNSLDMAQYLIDKMRQRNPDLIETIKLSINYMRENEEKSSQIITPPSKSLTDAYVNLV